MVLTLGKVRMGAIPRGSAGNGLTHAETSHVTLHGTWAVGAAVGNRRPISAFQRYLFAESTVDSRGTSVYPMVARVAGMPADSSDLPSPWSRCSTRRVIISSANWAS